MARERVAIEVVYALPDEQDMVALTVAQGTMAGEAIGLSGLVRRHKAIDPDSAHIGIFGRVVAPDTVLRHGDRVEIYRPLLADAKQARRRRAARGR